MIPRLLELRSDDRMQMSPHSPNPAKLPLRPKLQKVVRLSPACVLHSPPTDCTFIQKPRPPRQTARPPSAHPEDEGLEAHARSAHKPPNSNLSMIPSTPLVPWAEPQPRLPRHPQTRHRHHPRRNHSPGARNHSHLPKGLVGYQPRPL